MTLLDYQFAALAQGEQDVSTGVSKVLSEVEALQQSVGQTYATWTSQSASTAYQNLQRNWDTTEAQIRAAVSRFGVAVGQAGTDMSAAEAQNAGRLGA
jgi:uncharacterized protein YukE